MPADTPALDALRANLRDDFYLAALDFAAILDHRDRIYGSLDGPAFVKAYRALIASYSDPALARAEAIAKGE